MLRLKTRVLIIYLLFLVVVFIGSMFALSLIVSNMKSSKLVTKNPFVEKIAIPKANWFPDDNVDKKITILSNQFKIFINNNNLESWTKKDDTTLILMITIHQIGIFREILHRWDGPISLVLYIENYIADYQIFLLYEDLSRLERGENLNRVRMQIVTGDLEMPPFNYMRNLAWDIVKTDKILLWEKSFIPSNSLYYEINSLSFDKHQDIYIIPTFSSYCSTNFLLKKAEMIDSDYLYEIDDIDYNELSLNPSFFFETLKRLQMLASNCIIQRPVDLNSPIGK